MLFAVSQLHNAAAVQPAVPAYYWQAIGLTLLYSFSAA